NMLVTIPLHHPIPRRPVPVAYERGREHGKAPIFFFARRARGPDEPARFGGAGLGLGREAQEKRADAFLCRRKRKAAAGDEIETLGHSRNLDHHCAQCRAGERIARRAQGACHVGGPQEKYPRGIEAEFEKARGGKLAIFEGGKILSYPEKLLAFSSPHGQRRGKAACGGFASCLGPESLMQRAAKKPALQTGRRPP